MSHQDLKKLHPCAYSFCQLLACFNTSGSPSILFWRACSPKRKWSPKGVISDRQPEDELIPPWLLKLFKSDPRTAITPDIPAELQEAVEMDFIQVSEVKGTQYLALGNAWRSISIDTSTEDQRARLFELLSVFIHAYPEPYTELLCEEMTAQLSEVTEASCMPILSIVKSNDLKKFLEVADSTLSVPYLVSLLQFVFRLLSIKRNSQPRSLQALIPEIMGLLEQNVTEIPSNDISYARLLRAIQELTSQLSSMDRKISLPESLNSILQEAKLSKSYDERSNATIGLAFSSFFDDIRVSLGRKKSIELCSKWRPISEEAPSPMEVFTAANIITRDFIDLWLPTIRTGDLELRILTIRAIAQNNLYPQAGMLLEECLPDLEDRFGSESFEMSVALAELINYLNILGNAKKGEQLGCRALDRRRNEPLRDRTDTLYLQVAVADSLIRLSRYEEGQQLLREVIASSFASDSLVMKAALRLAKIQRRHGTDDDPLGIGSPLSEALNRVSSVSDKLRLEYLQELACAMSITRDKDGLGNGKVWAEIYDTFPDILESAPTEGEHSPPAASGRQAPRPKELGDVAGIFPRISRQWGAGTSSLNKSKSFYCVFCFERFENRKDWADHELSQHLEKQRDWICMPWGPVEKGEGGGEEVCVLCGIANPSKSHYLQHEDGPCAHKSTRERTFRRKEDLEKHFWNMHGQRETPDCLNRWSFEPLYEDWYWQCGFCDRSMSKWTDRVRHIGNHFQEGLSMFCWDPFISAGPIDKGTGSPVAWFPAVNMDRGIRLTLGLDKYSQVDKTNAVDEQHRCEHCNATFQNHRDAKRHNENWHSPRDIWCCPTKNDIRTATHLQTAPLACYLFPNTTLLPQSANSKSDVCPYCGDLAEDIFDDYGYDLRECFADWDIRVQHLESSHAFNKCAPRSRFYRADQFLQHLAWTHKLQLNNWTKEVMDSCKRKELLPRKVVDIDMSLVSNELSTTNL
ncbi:hypothetical protein BDZ45DRAFT_803804 [Acephala macrosclerotiorum]|nr:hypothetical protein BDZ45DRAFT_803804 [Acephala macrosclerotiorum]